MGIDAGAVIFVIERVAGSLAGLDAPENRQQNLQQAGAAVAIDLKSGTLALSPTYARVHCTGPRDASVRCTLAALYASNLVTISSLIDI